MKERVKFHYRLLGDMTKKQFIVTMHNYALFNGTVWEPWAIEREWERYEKGRSWCNEFFKTPEGDKYVDSH